MDATAAIAFLAGLGVGLTLSLLARRCCPPPVVTPNLWRVLQGRVNPRGQFDREMRFEIDGPHGNPCAFTDDQIFAAERDSERIRREG